MWQRTVEKDLHPVLQLWSGVCQEEACPELLIVSRAHQRHGDDDDMMMTTTMKMMMMTMMMMMTTYDDDDDDMSSVGDFMSLAT